MPISRDLVVSAYRLLLGREPEDESTIQLAMHCPDRETYLEQFLAGAEFRAKNPGLMPQSRAWVWADSPDGFLLKVNLSDDGVAWPAIENQFEPRETAFVKASIRPGHVAADIGANVGYFTMLMASIVGSEGHVYSFEPIPRVFNALRASVERNRFDSIATLFNLALSDQQGTITMMFADVTTNWGGSQFNAGRVELAGHTNIDVRTEKLDDLALERIDFIKLDTEGAEPNVLRGGRQTLSRFRPVILTEVHPQTLADVSQMTPTEYLKLFAEMGYRCHALADFGEVGEALAPESVNTFMNVVMIPNEFATVQERLSSVSEF